MPLPRFSIASLLAVIAILGVALAALRNPSHLWANVTFSVAFAMSRLSAWNAPDRNYGVAYAIGSVSLVSSDAFRQTGHSLVTLLAEVLGGVYARSPYQSWAARETPHGGLDNDLG
jgi:hypothetical protein